MQLRDWHMNHWAAWVEEARLKGRARPMNGGSGIYSNAYPTRNPESTSMTHGRLGWRSMKQPSGVRRMAFFLPGHDCTARVNSECVGKGGCFRAPFLNGGDVRRIQLIFYLRTRDGSWYVLKRGGGN